MDNHGLVQIEFKESVSGKNIVAVSPHFDDVALSMSGLIIQTGVPTTVVTVHGASPEQSHPVSEWDADCGFDSPTAAFATRQVEDLHSCAVMGATRLVLPNADGPYRDNSPLVGLDDLVREAATSADLYLPMGINQPDHCRVRDQAIAALVDLPRVRPFFYADLPYAAVRSDSFSPDRISFFSPSAWPQNVRAIDELYPGGLELVSHQVIRGDVWDRKRKAVLKHASQLAAVGAMDEVAGRGPLLAIDGLLSVEAVWRPRSIDSHANL